MMAKGPFRSHKIGVTSYEEVLCDSINWSMFSVQNFLQQDMLSSSVTSGPAGRPRSATDVEGLRQGRIGPSDQGPRYARFRTSPGALHSGPRGPATRGPGRSTETARFMASCSPVGSRTPPPARPTPQPAAIGRCICDVAIVPVPPFAGRVEMRARAVAPETSCRPSGVMSRVDFRCSPSARRYALLMK